jgi:uncharacterized protein (PEP-CTERM system associated)
MVISKLTGNDAGRRLRMRGTRTRSAAVRICSLSVAISAVIVAPYSAAQWRINPTLSVHETYTDNVGLSIPGSERSDWLTQVRPGISVSGVGARLRLNAAYAADIKHSAKVGNDTVSHHLSAGGKTELIQQFLFLDASANVSQQSISLLAPQAEGNANSAGNRTSVTTVSASPYLSRQFGTAAQGEARLTFNSVSTESNIASDSTAKRIDIRLSSGPAYRLYTWNLAYSRDDTDYSDRPDIVTQNITASGRRLVTSQFALVSSVGYEKSDYLTIGNAPRGSFWTGGFEWTPTPRTRVTATTGRRYFGASRKFDFSHRARLTTWSAGYSEDITSTRSQLLLPSNVSTASYLDTLFLSSIPDPIVRQLAVQDFILRNGLPQNLTVPLEFLTNQIFLTRRWQAQAGVHGIRNTVLGNVFVSSREAQESGAAIGGGGDFSSSSSIKQSGASVVWNWRFGVHSTSNLGLTYTRSQIPGANREDDRKLLTLGVTHQFQPHLSGAVNYRAVRSESNQAASGYSENAVIAALNARF